MLFLFLVYAAFHLVLTSFLTAVDTVTCSLVNIVAYGDKDENVCVEGWACQVWVRE